MGGGDVGCGLVGRGGERGGAWLVVGELVDGSVQLPGWNLCEKYFEDAQISLC